MRRQFNALGACVFTPIAFTGCMADQSAFGFNSFKTALVSSFERDPSHTVMSQTHIKGIVQSHMAQIRKCYEEQLKSNPDLAGQVEIEFKIAGDGVVKAATIHRTSLGSQNAETCFLNVFQKMVFQSHDGDVVRVQYPFRFES